MNEDTLRGQWTQLKGKVREQWGKLGPMLRSRAETLRGYAADDGLWGG